MLAEFGVFANRFSDLSPEDVQRIVGGDSVEKLKELES